MLAEKKQWEEIATESIIVGERGVTCITSRLDVDGGYLYRVIMVARSGAPPSMSTTFGAVNNNAFPGRRG